MRSGDVMPCGCATKGECMETDERMSALLAILASFDTPTICNALDLLRPDRRSVSFTQRSLVWARPSEAPMAGIAVTIRVEAAQPMPWTADEVAARRIAYWRYLRAAPKPCLVVAEDISTPIGFGGIWGDVNATIHQGLGCLGVVTNGAVRDLPLLPPGFGLLAGCVTPSHGHGHVVAWNVPVQVAGMCVDPGDIVHADAHGAVAFPAGLLDDLPRAAETVRLREAYLLAAARPGVAPGELAAAFRDAAALHAPLTPQRLATPIFPDGSSSRSGTPQDTDRR
jgi:regulator of RNase E activity RraA